MFPAMPFRPHRTITFISGVMVLAMIIRTGASGPPQPGQATPAPQPSTADSLLDVPLKNATVKFIIAISPQMAEYHVGDTVDVSVCLKNTGDKNITVYRPPEERMPEQMFSVDSHTKEQPKDSSSLLAAGGMIWSALGSAQPDRDFVVLQPGQATKPVKHKITFLLAGETRRILHLIRTLLA